MPEAVTESPQVRRDRDTAITAGTIVCVALPSVVLLVMDVSAEWWTVAAWLAGTALGGAVLPFIYWAPYRALGIVPYAGVAWLAAVAHGVYWNEWPAWAHGIPLGVIIGGLARGRRGEQPPWEVALLIVAVLLGVFVAWKIREQGRPFDGAGWFVLIAAVGLVIWTVMRLFRPVFELACEPLLWMMYGVQQRGPGFAGFPSTGPCLVIANHACWLDPLFLAKVLPRPITPMMTARFYDKAVIRRLMVAFGVIRVPEKALKKDAPEIQEAIAALDRGECVVIFPEGYLRRTEERPLRRFGQGIWQILQARPGTPVFAAWIEGGWGSYTSYFNGPPTKNKRKDLRRTIGVGMSAAVNVPAELLEEHLNARIYLMNLVSNARIHLGMEALPVFALPEKAEDAENESE